MPLLNHGVAKPIKPYGGRRSFTNAMDSWKDGISATVLLCVRPSLPTGGGEIAARLVGDYEWSSARDLLALLRLGSSCASVMRTTDALFR